MSESTPTVTNAGTTITGEHYSTRERIHDREDPDGILVVLETLETRSDRFELTDGVTVAAVNQAYEATDRIVLCIYERELDRLYPDWREMSPSALRSKYRIDHDQRPPGVHALPSSRVDRYEAGNYTDTGDHVRCHNCESWVESVPDWLEHVARDCEGVSVDE